MSTPTGGPDPIRLQKILFVSSDELRHLSLRRILRRDPRTDVVLSALTIAEARAVLSAEAPVTVLIVDEDLGPRAVADLLGDIGAGSGAAVADLIVLLTGGGPMPRAVVPGDRVVDVRLRQPFRPDHVDVLIARLAARREARDR